MLTNFRGCLSLIFIITALGEHFSITSLTVFIAMGLFFFQYFCQNSLILYQTLIPNSANPSINVLRARGLTISSLWGSNTYSTSSEIFVTGIIRLFRSNCPRGVQNKISLEAAMLCNRSEAFCREISLNSHYLVLFKNPWDKLQILTLVKLMYPNETAWFIKEYEEAVRRPYGYLFVDLKPTTPDKCILRTNVLPGEEGFDKGFEENRISQELFQYLRQETLMMPSRISEMQRIQNNMDNLLYRTNLEEDQKAKQYMQLQTSF